MFDIAWSEMMLIGAVALVVIKPKDLPGAMRACGEAVGKIRRMASEFQGQFNDAMRQAEIHDLKKQVEDVGGSVQAATKVDFNPIQTLREEIKGAGEALKGGTAAGAIAAAAPEAMASPAVPPAPEPIIPLPEPLPPFNPAELITPATTPAEQIAADRAPAVAPEASIPVADEEIKPKRVRKPKSADVDGSAA
jgi:sec-independent protein translocase protein TatB